MKHRVLEKLKCGWLNKVIMLALGSLCLWFYLADNQYWPFYDGRFESYRVPIKIGEHTYAFPRNYLYSYKQDKNGGKDGSVNIRILLPDFQPMSRNNYSYYKRASANSIDIRMYFDKDENLKRSEEFGKVKNGSFNTLMTFGCPKYMTEKRGDLLIYKCLPIKKYPYLTTVYTTLQQDFIFQCLESGSLPNPLCIEFGHTRIYGNIGLSISFSSIQGFQTEKIYQFVKSFIETAKVKGEAQ